VSRARALSLVVVAALAAADARAAGKPVPQAGEVAKQKAKAVQEGGDAVRGGLPLPPAPPPPARVVTLSPSLAPKLKAAIDEALNEGALDEAEVSFLAVDVKTGEVLADYEPDRLVNPASNAKLFTAAAALDVLKPEHRFKTEYYVQGQLKDGTLQGNLVVKGFGDPTVVTERLVRVANELYLFGIERITGGVIVDDSFFDAQTEGKGWETEEAPDRAYAAGVSALSLNYNAVSIYARPGSEDGRPAVVHVDPPCEAVRLEGGAQTERFGRGFRVVSEDAKDGTTLLTVEGAIGAREAPFRVYRRVWDPTTYFGSTLVLLLQQRGVKVQHRVSKGPVPAGARLVLVDKSPMLTEVVADLNHYSNNFIAETLIKAMGVADGGEPGTFEKGLVAARRFLEEKVGLQPGTYQFQNGSGLNEANAFTARHVVQLLTYMHRQFETSTEFTASLAVAGTQGTIGHRMRETPAERRLRGKTGTLSGVSALSGYVVQPAGDVVAFSILAQGYKKGVRPVWQVQNRIGTSFASNGEWNPRDEAEDEAGDAVSSAAAPVPETSPGGAP
jgi:serine-type D-Ala-D-Ala carboxypeptidase/endopeptidase (penicillin-binding protein 4)